MPKPRLSASRQSGRPRPAADDPTRPATAACAAARCRRSPAARRSRCDRGAGSERGPDRSARRLRGRFPQVDAVQLLAQQRGRQPAHPLVEIAEHQLRAARRAGRDDDRRQPLGLMAALEDARCPGARCRRAACSRRRRRRRAAGGAPRRSSTTDRARGAATIGSRLSTALPN